MRLLIFSLLLGTCFNLSYGQSEGNNPNTKAYTKQVSKISKLLTQKALEADVIFGQKKYYTTQSTSFYNKAAESLFYVLLCQDSSTIHYQIPLTGLTSCANEQISESRPRWCVSTSVHKVGRVVVYNKAGAMIHNRTYAKLYVPVVNAKTVKKLEKQTIRLVESQHQ